MDGGLGSDRSLVDPESRDENLRLPGRLGGGRVERQFSRISGAVTDDYALAMSRIE